MLCDDCMMNFVLPRLREDDIVVLQYLYNENANLPQVAHHKDTIMKKTELSRFCNMMAIARLEGYNLIALQPWSKSNNYYITEHGVRALTILSEKMTG